MTNPNIINSIVTRLRMCCRIIDIFVQAGYNKFTMSSNKAIQVEQLQALNSILKDTDYKPLCKISYGAYGQIFKIQDSSREYVLKVVSKQRMQKESKLHEAVIEGFMLSKLAHPGIVKYYRTIETKEHICQVQEHCQFGDLFAVMKKVSKSMELAERRESIALYYLAQALETLSYLHARGIIHRDFKMENIVVGGDLNSKLIDFGTAKPIRMEDFYSQQQIEFISKLRDTTDKREQDQSISSRKSFVGSANYLSPESISLRYSQASDIWSYGVMAYRLFHGKLPFQGENNHQIFKQIRQNRLEINQKLQPEIKELITSCLRANPEERASAADLKKLPYFKSIDFSKIFLTPSPIDKQILAKLSKQPVAQPQSALGPISYQIWLQKRMFFGNYKPRILKVYKRGDSLLMSYWYVDGKAPKNEFELMINDYAQSVNTSQFDVYNKDVKYTFKVRKDDSVDRVVDSINEIIKRHFQL